MKTPLTLESLPDYILHRAVERFRAARRLEKRIRDLTKDAPDEPTAARLRRLAAWHQTAASEWLVEVLHARAGDETECAIRYGREMFLAVEGDVSSWVLGVVPVEHIEDVTPA